MAAVPVKELTDKQLKEELEFVARMLGKGPIGTTLDARYRIAALIRESVNRMRSPFRQQP